MFQASPNDADQIFKAIDWRVQQLHMKEQKRETEGGKHLEASASSSSGSMTEKRPVTDSPEDSGPSKKVRFVSCRLGAALCSVHVHTADRLGCSRCIIYKVEYQMFMALNYIYVYYMYIYI